VSAGLSEPELCAVGAFLSDQGVPVAGRLSAALIAGGRSNLTFRLSDGRSQWVLRTPPRAGRTPSAHDVAREHAMTSALAGTPVPVPPAVALCQDEAVIGAPFAVSGFVAGAAIRSRPDLDELPDAAVTALAGELVSVLAALHRVDYAAAGLASFARPGSYAERQLRRWRGQWELVAGCAQHELGEQVAARLAAEVPEQRATTIVHGDFRIDNTLVDLAAGPGGPHVAAVLDWELAAIGDPVADVAMMCAYRDPVFDLIIGSPGAWTSERLPPAGELARMYEAAGGVPLAGWDFHLALAYYKVAVIAAGIHHRYRAGAGSGAGYDTAGQSVGPYLELALATLR
jgi:aminoglycoside phosphotransferase (APT) family kinase protein